MFCDWKLRKSGFPYECEQDKTKTVVAKTHFSRHLKLFTKVVLLIRNPYDALLSYANFLKAGHTGHPSNNILITGKFHSYDLKKCIILLKPLFIFANIKTCIHVNKHNIWSLW
jgi:hypothetical protein